MKKSAGGGIIRRNKVGRLIRKKIGNEVYINSVRDEKFKSDRITVNLITPLDRKEATVNALVPFVLRKGCKSCPDFTELNKRLAKMYGAILDADVSKQGGFQIVELLLQFADDKFAINGEEMVKEGAKLLSDIVFDPNLDENGLFPKKDLELEKEYLIDTINSDLNDKRTYAIHRAVEMEFEGEPFGVSRYGYAEEAEKITGEELAAAWRRLIKTARIEIMFVGPGDPAAVEEVFAKCLALAEREPLETEKAPLVPYKEHKEAKEAMDIVQGKLVMGFRMGAPATEREKNAARVLSAIYGGTPFSKLFMNVREKLSLCYYVTSHFERGTGVMFVDCGIEFESRDEAQSEILRQLENIANGGITEEELAGTKLIIKNSLGSVEDSLSGIDNWYMTCVLDGLILTPEEDAAEIDKITAEEVAAMAKRAKLSAVFFLEGGKAK